MATPRRVAMHWCASAAVAAVSLLAVAPATFAAPATPAGSASTIQVQVSPRHVWTPTGVVVRTGETVTIAAAGRMRFGAPPIDRLSPPGIPRGPKCAAARARQGTHDSRWPAPTLNCWSLIGRIGSAPAFEIGNSRTVHARTGGELFVGVNDDYLPDNSGVWIATVRTSPVPAPPAAVRPHASSGGSSRGPILAIALVAALIALVVLALLWRRTRSRRPDAAAAASATAAAPPAATASPAGDDVEQLQAAPTSAEGELSAGNILEVAFAAGSLRVGYNHFPEGTVVNWRVVQNATVITGEFTTDGRGAAQQVATVPLSTDLDPHAGAAEVTFTWIVGGVAFNYAVHRNPDS